MTFSTTVNGDTQNLDLEGHEASVDVLREQLGLTGTKLVCAGGVCGACTIQIDGVPVAGCLTPATAMVDAEVTTIEGIADGEELHPIQKAFLAFDGLQCGYCTPGFIVHGVAFYDHWRAEHGPLAPRPTPDRHTIAEDLAGHLCRCGAYEGIYRAMAAACRGDFDDGPVEPSRIDGPAKVTGQAVYTADRYPENVLHAVIVRSPVAAADVGPLPPPSDGAPEWIVDLLPDDRRVRFAGQALFAVAAESPADARQLAAEVPVQLTPRPFVIDPDEALADDAPLVYEDRASRKLAPNSSEGPMLPTRWSGNRRGPTPTPFMGTLANYRVRKARETGAVGLVELTLETEPQLHSAFEPHCTVADWSDPAMLKVWTSSQAIDHIRHLLTERYGLGDHQIEVNADFVGGGFGAKSVLSPDLIGAIELSRLARRPVRLVLDRREELTATGNRPGTRTDISILVADDGDIEAMVVDAESHAGVAVNGVYGALCVIVYDRSPRIARDSDVLTNAPPGAPFRGPGGPTYAWALEQAVDQAAHQLGWDPIELRQRWDGNEKRQALYRWARELDVWSERPVTGSQTGRFRRGVGVAAANWLYMHDPTTEIEVGVEGGRLVVTNATQDIGTGSKTLLARAVGEVFDVAPTDVIVRAGRSAEGIPHGPTSGGSRVSPSLWPTAVEAAENLRDRIGTDLAAVPDGTSVSARRGGDGGNRLLRLTLGDLQVGQGFAAAVHVSEVEVDTLTGKTRVLTVHGGLAVGRVFAPVLATSQCEGSIIQGIGLALYENQILDPHTGLTLTSNLEDYRIPQLGDVPEITIHFHTGGWEHVAGGGIGLGEVGTISPAASVGNAIFNATGWRPTVAPVRPDRLLDGLR